jgi:hypothetical protein
MCPHAGKRPIPAEQFLIQRKTYKLPYSGSICAGSRSGLAARQ